MTIIRKIRTKIKEGMLQEMYTEAKWMFGYAKVYWKAIVFYILMGVFGTVMGLGGSVASKNLINAVTGYDTGNIGWIVAAIIGMAVGSIVTNAISSRMSAKINVKIQNEIQADIYDKIMNTDWESLYEFRSGDLLNRLNNDVATVAGSVISWFPSLVTKLAQFIGALCIILYHDPTMAVIALLSAPVSLLVSNFLMKRMRGYNKRMREISSEMMSFHEDSFQNLQSIKAFDLIDVFSAKMRQVQGRYKQTSLEYNKFSIYTSTFMSVVGMIVSYSCFGWGVYRLWSGYIDYGTMTMFLQLASSLSASFSALISLVPSAIGATTSAGRVMSVVGLPKEIVLDNAKADHIAQQTAEQGLTVKLQNVNFVYNDGNRVLEAANITACPGEIIAIVGPSGEGKTTLIRILLGLINPVSGTAEICDVDGEACVISAATRKFFSYVPQGNTIFAGTVLDNLRMVREDATEEEVIEALKIACAYDFVQKMPNGIHSVIGERGKGLSEGQAQRLSIARAILRDAPILLFDEATSALDVATERRVLSNVMKAGKKKTCIVTTHRPSVLSMCDRVYRVEASSVEKLSTEEAAKLAMEF